MCVPPLECVSLLLVCDPPLSPCSSSWCMSFLPMHATLLGDCSPLGGCRSCWWLFSSRWVSLLLVRVLPQCVPFLMYVPPLVYGPPRGPYYSSWCMSILA